MGSCMSSLSADQPRNHNLTKWCNIMLNKNKKRRRSRNGSKSKSKRGLFSRFGVSTDLSKVQSGVAVSDGCYDENLLHRLSDRLFLNGASENACLFTQQGRKGTNQDAMLVWENFASKEDTIFCGVFDGHGPYGHMVAKKVRDSLPLKLLDKWELCTNDDNALVNDDNVSSNSEETASINNVEDWHEPVDGVEDGENLPDSYLVLRKSLLRAFKLMDTELKLHPNIDCFCSGSTTVTVIKKGSDLVIGNVGDSRAVLATRGKDNSLFPVQLTVDLKPNLPKEAARIQQCEGRVFALQDEPGVSRVWLPNNDSPGLAMARAFGDFCLKDYGLISVPDVTYHRLNDNDEFVVLATDGVWDVLSNKEVVDVIDSAPTRATAARALVDCAVRAWRLKFPTSKTDDCAVVCLFLKPPSSSAERPGTSVAKNCADNVDMDSLKVVVKVKTDLPESDSETTAGPAEIQLPATTKSERPGHVNEIEHIAEINEEKVSERCQSTRRLVDCISTEEEEEWSALEGYSRVNSLLTLPRFPVDEKKPMRKKKN